MFKSTHLCVGGLSTRQTHNILVSTRELRSLRRRRRGRTILILTGVKLLDSELKAFDKKTPDGKSQVDLIEGDRFGEVTHPHKPACPGANSLLVPHSGVVFASLVAEA